MIYTANSNITPHALTHLFGLRLVGSQAVASRRRSLLHRAWTGWSHLSAHAAAAQQQRATVLCLSRAWEQWRLAVGSARECLEQGHHVQAACAAVLASCEGMLLEDALTGEALTGEAFLEDNDDTLCRCAGL